MEMLVWGSDGTNDAVLRVFEAQKAVISTGDTVLGLLAPATYRGLKELDQIKGRSGKSYIVLAASCAQALELVDWSKVSTLLPLRRLMELCWPGPITLICPALQESISPEKRGVFDETIAIRVPDHQWLQELMLITGPLFSTSANRAGGPIPETVDQIDPAIVESCAYIIVDAIDSVYKDPLNKGSLNKDQISHALPLISLTPSTIVDCTGDSMQLVRQGAYPFELLKKQCEQLASE